MSEPHSYYASTNPVRINGRMLAELTCVDCGHVEEVDRIYRPEEWAILITCSAIYPIYYFALVRSCTKSTMERANDA